MTAPDFSVAEILAWARTKPADEAYDFVKAGRCALGQFAREMRGFSKDDAECALYTKYLAPGLLDAANGTYATGGDTFGGFVTRLEKLCPDVPPSEWTRLDAYMAGIETVSA